MAQALMFQGTGSDVGKSLIVAGLARAFARRGLAVRPFKPQNMSNNAAVTLDGGEIGRAQALQARACGVAPSFHMNPVLLKPESEAGAQLVVQGRVEGRLGARDYQRWKGRLLPRVLESFQHMAREADLLLVEGAGSASEVNLRAGDIANMGFAEAAGLPVILIVDIERGGAIASLVGTWTLLDPPERARLRGYLVNKFRGDPTLFSGGIETVARETGLHCLGIVPYFAEARRLPAEDSLALDTPASVSKRAIKIVVPRLPRLSNFDDLDPLIAEPDVAVAFVGSGTALPGDADLVVLPGSKATIADLASLRAEGWDVDIAAHLRRGGWLLGLCGGFQMLGRRLSDLQGVEGPPQEVEGLGLLEVDTLLGSDKRLSEATGRDIVSGESVAGYEMHLGRTSGPGLDNPFLILDQRPDGAVSADGRVAGCYLHGLFAADGFRHAFLSRIRRRHHSGLAYERGIEETLDRLAAHLEQNLELDRLFALASDVTIQDQPGWNLRSQAT